MLYEPAPCLRMTHIHLTLDALEPPSSWYVPLDRLFRPTARNAQVSFHRHLGYLAVPRSPVSREELGNTIQAYPTTGSFPPRTYDRCRACPWHQMLLSIQNTGHH